MAYDENNIFAQILRGEAPAHIVYEDTETMAILDVMPQADGHTLVLPRRAAENVFDLDEGSMTAIMRTGQRIAVAVKQAFSADGIRFAQFNGAAAGQTVFHYHLHIIPCHENRPLKRHSGGMADPKHLEKHATALRAALSSA